MSSRIPGRLLPVLLGGALLGVSQTYYGPLFPVFSEKYGVAVGAVGTIVAAHYLGMLLFTALAGPLLARLGFRRALVLGPLGLGLGAVGLALAPAWAAALFFAFVLGAGFGWANTAQLAYLGAAFPERRFFVFNLESAFYGLGSMLGPGLVALMRGSAPLGPYLVLAVLSAGVAALYLYFPQNDAEGYVEEKGPLPRWVVGFMAFFFLYVGLEVSGGHWGAYQLEAVGESFALWIGLYWGMQTIGRFFWARFAAASRPLALAFFLLLSGGFFLLGRGYGYALAGFFLAPVFPGSMAWMQGVLGPSGRVVAAAMVAGGVGGVVFPPLVGLGVAALGVRAVPLALGLLAFLTAAFALFLLKRLERRA